MIWSTSALGADVSTIRAQLSQGDYSAAYAEAEDLQTAEGQALASEVLLSELMLGQAKKVKKQAKRAREFAEAALALDPTSQDARLQYAVADGIVVRETGDVSSLLKKLPAKTQAVIQAYRDDFPNDPRGDALLGIWHLTITRKAGAGNAKKWFGANLADGQALSKAAWAARPDDIVVGVNYAFSLLALSDKVLPDSEEARRILSEIVVLQPKDYLEEVLQSYAKEALAKLDDRDEVRDYALLFLSGKTPTFDS